jgi:4-alpha-glucanotransferase
MHPLFSRREAGVLLHISSLPPSSDGGLLGDQARAFIDWLAQAGFRWWQMLPVGPTGPVGQPGSSGPVGQPGSKDRADGNSPYSSPSAFAGNADFVGRSATVPTDLEARQEFLRQESYWLQHWADWLGEDSAVETQLQFQIQWQQLRDYAHQKGVRLLGDIPIFVEADSADVAAHPELFRLDASGKPEVVTGVPPDDFSETGQRWGHPHYRWSAHAAESYRWWTERFSRQLRLFDAVRIDHFIGFHNAWEVPGDAATAEHGQWTPAPGREILTALLTERIVKNQVPALPLLAEDLGAVTPPVHALRQEFGLPGMRIVQNAFWQDDSRDLPDNCPSDSVAYPGTHDNDTVVGWFRDLPHDIQTRVLQHTGGDAHSIAGDLVRLTLASGSNLAILPMQDLLGLGSEARMNTPATTSGNWSWRLPADFLPMAPVGPTADLASEPESPNISSRQLAARIRAALADSGRLPSE